MFRVYWKEEYPKKKKKFYKGNFEKRQQARQWCRNNGVGLEGLTILHPDRTHEKFEWDRNY